MLQKEKKVLQSKKKVLEKGDAYEEGRGRGDLLHNHMIATGTHQLPVDGVAGLPLVFLLLLPLPDLLLCTHYLKYIFKK